MRITTAGMMLLLPRIAMNTSNNKNANQSIIGLIEKNQDSMSEVSSSNKLHDSQLSIMLRKSAALLGHLDKKLVVGFPIADAIDFGRTKNPFEKLSYNKGDDAESIGDFAKAVRQEYTVFSNRNAYKANNFKNNIIVIYGEDHTNPRLPSIRNDKGALLLENPDLNHCLEKHKRHPDNICKNIDLADNKGVYESMDKLLHLSKSIIRQLDWVEYKKLTKKMKDITYNKNTMAIEANNFIEEKYQDIYSSMKNSRTKRELNDSYISYGMQFKEIGELLSASMKDRGVGMANEAKKVIKEQKKGDATTIIVSMDHVKPLFIALQKEFPSHAIVGCYGNRFLADLNQDGRKNLLQGMKADQVKIYERNRKTEL